jgi:hypothetical protein
MAKSSFKKVSGQIDPGKAKKTRHRVFYQDGKRIVRRVIESESPDLTAELTEAFKKNVRRARKANSDVRESA